MKIPINTISAEDLLQEMEEAEIHEDLPITVINVLDRDYFLDCRIKDSINIPVDILDEEVEDWDRGRKIVVYCASEDCSLSGQAYQILDDMGFSNIRAFEGGVKQWKEQHYPLEGSCQKPYLKS